MEMERSNYTLGGALWLNLLNTVRTRHGEETDLLDQPAETAAWLEANGLPLPAAGLGSLIDELRGIRCICRAVYEEYRGQGVLSDATVAALAAKAEEAAGALRLSRGEGGNPLRFEFQGKSETDHARGRVLQSIADTLAAVSPDRLRQCEHEACILHFADTSKSGKRRWCQMETCGNRHKAAEFQARKHRKSMGS